MPYQGETGYCLYRCADPSTPYEKYRCRAGTINLMTTHEEIMQEVMMNGPVMVSFTMYSDILSYSSGIYHQTSNIVVGGHAVKLIGWNYDGNG